ncbi:hypothetical protein N7454_010648 [Penicillium verhagenii]|nr:hypothetical protein N7454_010648 [Penicillium verhagenii]
MSLQVDDGRSRTRSKSRERSRSRSRDNRVSSSDLNLSVESTSRPRSRSPAVVEIGKQSVSSSSNRNYGDLNEAEVDRQYKLMKESRLRDADRDRDSRPAPRSPGPGPGPARSSAYDVRRDDSDDSARRRDREERRRQEDREHRERRNRDHYEHSGDDRDMRTIQPREYGRPPQSPLPGGSSRNGQGQGHSRSQSRRDDSSDDDSVDDDLAYGATPGSHPSYARPGKFQYAQQQAGPPLPQRPSTKTDWAPIPECERPGFVPPTSQPQSGMMPGAFPSSSAYDMPATMAPSFPTPSSQPYPSNVTSGAYAPSHYRTASASDAPGSQQGYAHPAPYQYAQVDPNVRYTSKAAAKPAYTASPEAQFSTMATGAAYPRGPQHDRAASHSQSQPEQPIYSYKYDQGPQFSDKPAAPPPPSPRAAPQKQYMEITPGGGRRPHSLSVSSANNLAVAGAAMAGHHPPASPLLEPYHGTYQSMSPMPSPIVIPSIRDDDISDLEPLDGETSSSESRRRRGHTRTKSSISEREYERDRHRDRSHDRHDRLDSRHRSSNSISSSKEKLRLDRDRDHDYSDREDKRRTRPIGHDHHSSVSSLTGGNTSDSMILISPKGNHGPSRASAAENARKRVSFYDAGPDADAMQSALNHTRNIDNKIIIQTLPMLSSDQILTLRAEYKARVKVHGKGINLAKHLRLKLGGTSSFSKVAYATALGRWESEAYWANCYYQAGTSRRELLIESLMGRSNAAIREIKACFRDTRYENSLERCMRAELKADKFRVAVLLVLEEKRQEEREPLDARLVRQDVSDLHRALVSRDGGETAMIHIIVLRSDAHLREVLRAYEAVYGDNFARAMIAKSRNLVGETLAHILNGAINRPMRDALLLHQALRESKSGRERSELLISRLVRLHWEPRHFEQVKIEYRRRYGERIEEAIAEEVLTSSNGGEWGEFCIELVHSSSAA